MIKKYTLALVAILFFAVSCNKDKGTVKATVIDTGDITDVGCGYILQLQDSAVIQPNYIPSAYQHGGIKVKIKYTHTGVIDTCAFGSAIYNLVSLQSIQLDQ